MTLPLDKGIIEFEVIPIYESKQLNSIMTRKLVIVVGQHLNHTIGTNPTLKSLYSTSIW